MGHAVAQRFAERLHLAARARAQAARSLDYLPEAEPSALHEDDKERAEFRHHRTLQLR